MNSETALFPSFVLVTAAHNEEAYIEKTIQSVISQEVVPRKWVIVDDGSTDNTAMIVSKYVQNYSFIELLALSQHHAPDFGAQVHAINAGCDSLRRSGIDFDFIGNLDSDISFDNSYYGQLFHKFEADLNLGLAGGWLYEKSRKDFAPRRGNRSESVPHGIQVFRRLCFEQIGGYIPLRYGAPDWCAEASARMHGWRVESFPDLRVLHHRPTGRVSGRLRYLYRSGLAAYSLGSHPAFEVAKCIRRLHDRPYLVGALSRLLGFAVGCYRREERQVSSELVRFLRREQARRLRMGCLTSLGLVPPVPDDPTRKTQNV